ncbi:hypothetical protein J2Y66_003883 [Paenarthrobacter nitroguajacolicus]|uniref:DUF4192 domain-containing protein n=1 Tax=Paenarthrobacter nitroguajacolicus TaxID=211146 RepID=UPI00285D9E08|nr:DUF4192 domain-containing protein [Paenarthrobacter nitroguajacolicus]MDR6989368.1 hypothetical protein [Paenarthrobacter nitroguajacolicus]
MTTKRTLSIHQPEDILGYIPHLLGYWPEDSLVAITMQGKVLGATLRVDLPAGRSPGALACFADQIRSYLVADEDANGVVLAVYTDAGWTDGTVLPQTMPLIEALQQSLDPVDLSVRDAWLIGSEYWRSAFCTNESCCPDPGLPVARIKDSRLSAELVYMGSTVGPSPRSGPGASPLVRSGPLDPLVLEAESRYGERILGRWRSERCLESVLAVWQHFIVRVGHGSPLETGADAELLGFLRTTLKVPAWRDAVLVMAAAGIDSATSGAEAFGLFDHDDSGDDRLFDEAPPFAAGEHRVPAPGAQWPSAASGTGEPGDVFTYGDVLLGMQPDRPQWSTIDGLHRVLAGLCVEDETGEVAAAVFTLQGWISWCKGSGSIAHACLLAAEAARPGYRLAELLMEILGQGAVCAWARSSRSAWRGSREAHA